MVKIAYDLRGLPDLRREDNTRLWSVGVHSVVAKYSGYVSVTDQVDLLKLGNFHQRRQMTFPGLGIPSHSPTGRQAPQYRPDRPRADDKTGKPIKYESPHRSAPVLSVHPIVQWALGLRDDPELAEAAQTLGIRREQHPTVAIVESRIKADAVLSRGILAIALQGVDAWQKNKKPIPDLDSISWSDLRVVLVPDSNIVELHVHRAMRTLKYELDARGAVVTCKQVPRDENGRHQGPDDWLADYRTEADFWALPNYDLELPHSKDPEYRRKKHDVRMTEQARAESRIEIASADLLPVVAETWDQMSQNHSVRELVEGTSIPEGGVVALFGDSGSFKSLTVQDLTWHLGTVKKWHRREARRRLTTIYFALEGADGIGSRARGWAKKHPELKPPRSRWRLVRNFGDLAHPEYRRRVVERAVEIKADVAVIDTYGIAITLFKGGTGSENTDANAFVRALRDIADEVSAATGKALTWILIHHEGLDSGRPRGATAFHQACDLVLRFEKGSAENVSYVTVFKPSRDLAHLFKPWTVRVGPARWGTEPEQASIVPQIDDGVPKDVGQGKKSKKKLAAERLQATLDAVTRKEQSTAAIADAVGFHRTTVQTHLKKLAKQKKVTMRQQGQVNYWKRKV